MKKVMKYQTRDRKLHSTYEEARRHAENAYGRELARLAAQLCQLGKYTEVGDYIDKNLNAFSNLSRLKEDIELTREEEDET